MKPIHPLLYGTLWTAFILALYLSVKVRNEPKVEDRIDLFQKDRGNATNQLYPVVDNNGVVGPTGPIDPKQWTHYKSNGKWEPRNTNGPEGTVTATNGSLYYKTPDGVDPWKKYRIGDPPETYSFPTNEWNRPTVEEINGYWIVRFKRRN